MAKDEKLRTNTVQHSTLDGKFRVAGSAHVVAESEDSTARKVNIVADRATIARAHERNFFGRMWHGLTETYQEQQLRKLLSETRNGASYSGDSAAIKRAEAELAALKLQSEAEAQALAQLSSVEREHIIKKGEATTVLDSDSAQSEEQKELIAKANSIVSDFTLGLVDEPTLTSKVNAFQKEINEAMPGLFGEAPIASDLEFIARESREAYLAHHERMAVVEVDLQLCLGQVAGGLDTQEHKDIADILVDWAQKNRATATLINPVTVGVGASLGGIALRAPAKLIPVVGGVAGGAFAAVRRVSKEKKDRNLSIREAEIGYETHGPRTPGTVVEKGLAALVGQTDFREFTFKPISALIARENIHKILDVLPEVKKSDDWQENSLIDLVHIKVGWELSKIMDIGLITYGEKRGENGEIVVSGTRSINQDRKDLIVAANALEGQLRNEMGDEFEARFSMKATKLREKIVEELRLIDKDFSRHKIWQGIRSGFFAGVVGGIAGFTVKELEEKVGLVGGIHDQVSGSEEKVIHSQGTEQVSLGSGVHREVLTAAGPGKNGLAIEVPDGYSAHLDTATHTLSIDGAGEHYQVVLNTNATAGLIEHSFKESGLGAHVSVNVVEVGGDKVPMDAIVLSDEFLKSHGLTDVTAIDHSTSFGHAYEVLGAGQNDYNELTLYSHTNTEWSFSPLGLDGGAIKPFVFGDKSSWTDTHLAANAPVDPNNLVPMFQLEDHSGVLHTLVGQQTNGHFEIPKELVNPQTGEIDGLKTVGYGMIEDQHGKIIDGHLVSANSAVMDGGQIHWMASVPYDQKTRMIEQIASARSITVDNLTKVVGKDVDTVVKVDSSWNLPQFAFPFAPRIFPDIAQSGVVSGEKISTAEAYVPVDNNISPEAREAYRRSFSASILENPEATLNASEELKAYIDSWPKAWSKRVEQKASRIGPMNQETKLAVMIPVASHQEGKNIYGTLEQYAKQKDLDGQPLAPESFELILHLNRPKGKRDDGTSAEVERFKQTYPHLRVNVINSVFAEAEPIGNIRKLATDVAVFRAISSGINRDVVFVSNDADAIEISDKYIVSITGAFEEPKNAHVDAFLGKVEWFDGVLKNYPVFYASNRFIQYLDAVIRHGTEEGKSVGSSGANFAFRSSIYAAVGGYDLRSRWLEDVDFGKRIKIARANVEGEIARSHYPISYLNRASIVTNPRRGIAKYLEGVPVAKQWEDFENTNDVRNINIETYADQKSGETMDVARLEKEINSTINYYELSVDSTYVTRALNFLGVKYHIQDGVVKLDSIRRLEHKFERFLKGEIAAGEILPDREISDAGEEAFEKEITVPSGWVETAAREAREVEALSGTRTEEMVSLDNLFREKFQRYDLVQAEGKKQQPRGPMSQNTKFVVTLPVLTDKAAANVGAIVESIAKQKDRRGRQFAQDQYEVYVYLEPETEDERLKARKVLLALQDQNPDLRVYFFSPDNDEKPLVERINAELRMFALVRKFAAVNRNKYLGLLTRHIPVIGLDTDEVLRERKIIDGIEADYKRIAIQQLKTSREGNNGRPVSEPIFEPLIGRSSEELAKMQADELRKRSKDLAGARKELEKMKRKRNK